MYVGVSTYLANLMGCINFILKGCVGVTVMMWIRWTFPRLRFDQLMTFCWTVLIPLAIVNLLATAFFVKLLVGVPGGAAS